jgi:alkanesulfonate monooxygenase SsuD/methylene tetrahydromethanopterin reductase-like flavin-dependent oxidoreductase (luciferase family)
MFGAAQREHDERYEYAEDFFTVVNQLMSEEGSFDVDSAYFTIKGAYSEPKPVQAPRPVYMAAGLSPRGRDFAAKFADVSFIPASDLDSVAATIADTKRRAREDYGRDILVFGQTSIVCADTEQEARDYYRHYVDELGDFEAARNLVASLFGQTIDESGSQRAPIAAADTANPMLRAMVAGHGGTTLVGTPEQIVDGFVKRSEAGLDGSAIAWVNYEDGLVDLREKILPLMIQAGLRVDEPVPDAATLPSQVAASAKA